MGRCCLCRKEGSLTMAARLRAIGTVLNITCQMKTENRPLAFPSRSRCVMSVSRKTKELISGFG